MSIKALAFAVLAVLTACKSALAGSSPDLLARMPDQRDGAPAYETNSQWLDPADRTWIRRDAGRGQAVWVREDPAALPIDEINGDRPAAAYGTRRLTTSYNGPALLLSNPTSRTTLAVGFLPDGQLDQWAAAAFCGTGECRVAKWFDQSGHGRDAIQSDPTAQPAFRLSHRVGNALSLVWDYEATSGGPVRSLLLPASLAIDSGNMTILWTGRFHNASIISPLVELGDDAEAFNFGFWDAHGDFFLGTRNHLMEREGHATLTPAIGVISSSQSTGLSTSYRDHQLTMGKLPPVRHRGGMIGQTATYKQGGMMELSSLILYDRALTLNDQPRCVQALGEAFRIPQQQREVYVADGDSLTQGIYTSYLQSYSWYMEALLPHSAVLYDAGWAAKTLGGANGLLSRFNEFTAKLFDPNAPANVISLHAGTNDIQNGTDDRTLFRLIQDYAAVAHKIGFKVVLTSILPRATFDSKMEGYRASVNTMLRTHWKEFADGFADFASEKVFSDQAGTANGAVYVEDGIHLTEIGNQLLATDLAAAVRPLLP